MREGLQARTEKIDAHLVDVASHRVTKDRYAARVHDATNGSLIGRGSGATRLEAEERALESARLVLGLQSARASFRRGVDKLNASRPPDSTE